MIFQELEKGYDIKDSIFLYVDEDNINIDFDTKKMKTIISYYKGYENQGDKQTDILLTLSDNYISDTYRMTGKISDKTRVKAAFDAGKQIFDNEGIPYQYNSAIFMSGHPVIYTPNSDMTSIV